MTKTGRLPSCASTQRPASTPTRVVTRSERPISEKSAAYAQPRPGSIICGLAKPGEYTSGPRSTRPPVPERCLSERDETVDVDPGAAHDDQLDLVGGEGAEVPRPEDLPVQRRRAVLGERRGEDAVDVDPDAATRAALGSDEG